MSDDSPVCIMSNVCFPSCRGCSHILHRTDMFYHLQQTARDLDKSLQKGLARFVPPDHNTHPSARKLFAAFPSKKLKQHNKPPKARARSHEHSPVNNDGGRTI